MRTFTKKKRKTSIICNLFVNLYLEVHQISMKLYFRKQGEGTPLIILHGLWGASENWLPVAHSLEDRFQVILPDIRNHGQSPHADEMNYEVMSDDIIELIEDLRLPVPPHIVGHSMGGKIVMALLLKRPDIVNKAIVVDIAPVSYSQQDGGSHYKIIDFMANFDFTRFTTREEVRKAIQQHFKTERSQQLFLKNIKKTASGFEWKINHRVLSQHFDEISGCPGKLTHDTYDKEILFIKGEQSNLITSINCLQAQFPAARLKEIPQCGHWIHSEQPEKLAQAIRDFLLFP